MAKLTYSMMVSLDGYINDAHGDFDWGQIEHHPFKNGLVFARYRLLG